MNDKKNSWEYMVLQNYKAKDLRVDTVFIFVLFFSFLFFFPLETLQDQEFCGWLADPVKASLHS